MKVKNEATFFPLHTWEFIKVCVQGVAALGGHFATLCQELDFYDAFFSLLIFKKKDKYFDTFNHSYSKKSNRRLTDT